MNLLELARSALPAMPTDATNSGISTTVRAQAREASDAPVRQWRIRYPNGAAMDVLFAPLVTRAEVAKLYPGAAIEPVPHAPTRAATPTEAAELRLLIAQVLAASTDDDRQEALRVALADVDAGLTCLRALATAMQRRP